MGEWKRAVIADCLDSLSLPSGKVKARDYKDSGALPVVDQGQDLIAGWTDDAAGLVSENLPLVVFGDHTRVFKYVDFPFVRGADGTQVLKPKVGIDPLFFYYACRAIQLPSRGYNRHFKLLREQEVPIPPPDEQSAIAGSLDLVRRAIDLQGRAVDTSEELKRVAMQHLFTRGLRGEEQRASEIGPVPSSWKPIPIRDLGQVVTGTTPPTGDRANYKGGEIPFIAPGDIEHGRKVRVTGNRITEKGLKRSRPIPAGASCFVCIGSTIGKVGLATARTSSTNQQINTIVPGGAFDSEFVFHLLTRWSDHIAKQASPSPVPILSKGVFEQIEVCPSPDPDEQREIAAILDAIDRKIDLHRRKRAVLEELFQSLLHKLMTGEVRVADLDLSALAAEPQMALAT